MILVPNAVNDWHGIDVLALSGGNLTCERCYVKNEGTPMSACFIDERFFLTSYESGKIVKFATNKRDPIQSVQVAPPGIPIMKLTYGPKSAKIKFIQRVGKLRSSISGY